MNTTQGRLAALAVAAVVAGACSAERTIIGSVDAVSLTARVRPGADLATVATTLGWTAGVPGAVVVLQRAGSTSMPIDSAVTDAMGVARFANITAGNYTVRASRQLTADDRTRATALRAIDALAGTATAAVGNGDNAVYVTLRGSGPGTLVFSEIYPTFQVLSNGSAYYWGDYIKIYNNGADTIQLAGKLLANPISGWYAASGVYTCELFAEFKSDPAGLWAQYVYRFPPTAKAMPPGGGALIVTDAIDHRTIASAPGFYDLSRADYEFRGSADVVNPLAQGMLDVGPRRVPDTHGWRPWDNRLVFALTEPLDLDTLPKRLEAKYSGADFVRLPTAALLDVVQWQTTTPHSLSLLTDCPPSVVADIDAAEAKVLTITDTLSIHRRVARTLPNGRVVLQRTRSSAADFEARPASPGKLP